VKLVFATNNPHKLDEIKQALKDRFELLSLKEAGFEGDIPETGDTLEANALEKARFIYERLEIPVFSDDTGLEIDCLDGRPGVHTAHYSGSRDAEANMMKVLREMKGCKNRKARFRTVIAFVSKDENHCFEGKVEGRISDAPRGEEGFGYDPVFIPENKGLTFAEMGMEEKALTNHRVRALEEFIAFLKSNY
jgi:XTP/dITP diphosphohydrolase